jgi:hypothetical protein
MLAGEKLNRLTEGATFAVAMLAGSDLRKADLRMQTYAMHIVERKSE